MGVFRRGQGGRIYVRRAAGATLFIFFNFLRPLQNVTSSPVEFYDMRRGGSWREREGHHDVLGVCNGALQPPAPASIHRGGGATLLQQPGI